MKKNKLFFFILLFVFFGCNGLPDNLEELKEYVANPNNGYIVDKEVNEVQIKAMFRPTKLMVLQELENYDAVGNREKDSLFKKYNSAYYFLLSFQKDNNEILTSVAGSREEFNNLQNNLTFKMNELVFLTNGKDTLNMIDFISPRTYGMSKSTNVLMVFKKDSKKISNDTFELNVKDVGLATGDITFKFPTKLIED